MYGKALQNILMIGKSASNRMSDRRVNGVISMILLHKYALKMFLHDKQSQTKNVINQSFLVACVQSP